MDLRTVFAVVLLVMLSSGTPALSAHFVAGALPRQANLGFAVDDDAGRLVVARVVDGGPADRAGVRNGDELVSIGGRRFARGYEVQAMLESIDGGTPVALKLKRAGAPVEVTFTPPPREFEALPGVDSYYDEIKTSDGARLRSIVTRPTDSREPLPVIFFTQWVSCGSLEFSGGGLSRQYLKVLAQRSGAALIRVERSGTGDSIGPACHELDYDTEVAHYREALAATLARYDWLDPSRVVIYGSSLGSTIAPLVAEGRKVAGIVVQGGGAVTYLERMINFDRQQLERTGVPPQEIHARMLRQIAFHVEYLVKGRLPDDIARDGPDMAAARAAIRGLGQGEHYGRPYAWHQQAAKENFQAAWAAIDAPVLVIFGEFDQFEGRHGHALVADTVNRRHPGRATFVEIARMDHEGELYDTIDDAYLWANTVSGPAESAHHVMTGPMLRWLRDVVGFPVREPPAS